MCTMCMVMFCVLCVYDDILCSVYGDVIVGSSFVLYGYIQYDFFMCMIVYDDVVYGVCVMMSFIVCVCVCLVYSVQCVVLYCV